MRRLSLIAGAVVVLSCSSRSIDSAIDVQVDTSAVTVQCVEVDVSSSAGQASPVSFNTSAGQSLYSVAVFPGGALGSSQIAAFAYGLKADCQTRLAVSGIGYASFGTGLTSLALKLEPCDGGCQVAAADGGSDGGADSGISDAGADSGIGSDAGSDAGVDGGSDAGADAGRDAGDCLGGLEDAGQVCPIGYCAADGTCALGFSYKPSNFDKTKPGSIAGGLLIDCAATLDTGVDAGPIQLCQSQVMGQVLPQGANAPILLISTKAFDVTDAGSLTVTGPRALVIATYGNAFVDGTILAGAPGIGPGANVNCGGRTGASGTYSNACGNPSTGGGGGGGGGGFGTGGGQGGQGCNNANAKAGGAGPAALSPLVAGCPGGAGGGQGGDGGTGGGAIQLSASGRLVVNGSIASPGAGGQNGNANQFYNGGGGGGSGGAILLEAAQASFSATAAITANGGGGGGGGSGVSGSSSGTSGSVVDNTPAPGGSGGFGNYGAGGSGGSQGNAPQDGNTGGNSPTWEGGGAGGAVGVIQVNTYPTCSNDGGVFSPAANSNQSNCP